MTDRSPSWTVRVPASTSNLGPGFDFLGLAFGLYLDVTARRSPSSSPDPGHTVHYSLRPHGGLGPESATESPPGWTPSEDLCLRALDAFEQHTQRTLPPLELHVHSQIPVGRGFGSSGASIAATLLIAAEVDRSLLGPGQDRSGAAATTDDLLELALSLEGHPDNGTASLLGGCTAAVPTPGDPVAGLAVVRPPIHESIGLAVAWPDEPLFTPAARAALPEDVPLADAIENPRRLALLLEGLRIADPRLLSLGIKDRLHERFRRRLIPGADAAVERALESKAYAACVSGAGSGIVAIGPAGGMEPAARAMAEALSGGIGVAVEIVREPPSVTTVA